MLTLLSTDNLSFQTHFYVNYTVVTTYQFTFVCIYSFTLCRSAAWKKRNIYGRQNGFKCEWNV